MGRVCAGGEGARFELKSRPDIDSPKVGSVYRDDVIVWLREVVASRLDLNRINQRWIETPNGYIYGPYVQPVENAPNKPVTEVPVYGKDPGAWVEVTVPFIDFTNEGSAKAPWLKETLKPRLYYSQVMWLDQIKHDADGRIYYRLSEKYGSYGDVFWAPGEAFRIIQPDELAPIHPEVKEKRVVVNLTYQTLSCYEGKDEVYFCRVSTGYDGATPVGIIPTWRKMVSTHMSGGTTGAGFDTPGIGWTVLFSNDGAAIHSTFWHNEFGLARSHGCVNALPEDAKWIFKWTVPAVPYDPGDITIYSMDGSTKITVEE
jgi:lipoprotein-anchoring transpeptidase ErfK/SrfK